ncbi:MAG: DUF3307 domain-containing protein [Elusimicrobia bacterium]|nr:DUF3307 domain-containing protein [Elusimicrobiota bacterium]
MLIFWRLILGHLLADFTFQTNAVNAWKRRNVWGMLVHCGMHPVIYAVLTFPYLGRDWVQVQGVGVPGWACILLIFIFHFLEDEFRIFSIFKYNSPDNTLFFIWDQTVHYACIFIFIPIGLGDLSQGWFPEKWPILMILGIVVTHFATVLLYFFEKDMVGANYPNFDEKYLAMGARLVLMMCFLLPGTWWAIPALGWMVNLLYMRYRRVMDFSWFSLSFGGLLSAACGVAARLIYYAPSPYLN